MLAANGHAQYRRSLYRVGCEQQDIVNRYAQTVLALIPKNACHFTDFPIAHQLTAEWLLSVATGNS
jgi:hypothetical protein